MFLCRIVLVPVEFQSHQLPSEQNLRQLVFRFEEKNNFKTALYFYYYFSKENYFLDFMSIIFP